MQKTTPACGFADVEHEYEEVEHVSFSAPNGFYSLGNDHSHDCQECTVCGAMICEEDHD